MSAQPFCELFTFHLSCRQLQNDPLLLVNRGSNLLTVQYKKRFHCEVTDTLVAVNERMILRKAECVRRGEKRDIRLVGIGELLLRPGEC